MKIIKKRRSIVEQDINARYRINSHLFVCCVIKRIERSRNTHRKRRVQKSIWQPRAFVCVLRKWMCVFFGIWSMCTHSKSILFRIHWSSFANIFDKTQQIQVYVYILCRSNWETNQNIYKRYVIYPATSSRNQSTLENNMSYAIHNQLESKKRDSGNRINCRKLSK